MRDEDSDWKAAEEALEKARLLPGGPARIEALREPGTLRFAADRRRQANEPPGRPSKFAFIRTSDS
jgi:hypothetical protein